MGDFLLCILQYVIIAVIIFALGCVGGYIGYLLRKKKNAKQAAAVEATK